MEAVSTPEPARPRRPHRALEQSTKLQNVLYEIRGPVHAHAARLEAEGHRILKLNIGNPAPFGFEAPDVIMRDMIAALPYAQGYSESKGILSARRAIVTRYELVPGFPELDVDDIYLGNGVSELITMTMQALLDDGDEVLIPAPDYPLWTAMTSLSGGTPVHYLCDEQNDWNPDIADIESKITDKTKALLVINPNNPTGRTIAAQQLRELAGELAQRGGLLVVDEAFADFEGAGSSLVPQLPGAAAVVLRSFGKTYGLAGMRLGFAITSDEALCQRLRAEIGPWAVPAPAIAIGTAALRDSTWLSAASADLASDCARLDTLLQNTGFEIIGGTHLFRLARHARARAIADKLGRAGILARSFPAKAEWLRFGLPGSEAEWQRLASALAETKG